jgi:predicted AAA+ superfamily ATPase
MKAPIFRRNIESYLVELMRQYPAVAIVGARQVGKTTLAKAVGGGCFYIDMERGDDFDRFTRDPEFFFKQYSGRIIFDEAQVYPELFTILRGVIDENRSAKGRFILTGSSSLELLRNISESLAGRIAIIELGTLKTNEYYDQPLSPFYEIFKTTLNANHVPLGPPPLSREQIQQVWFKGGYPEPVGAEDFFYQEWMTDYQLTYINRDIAQLFPKLDKIAYRRFISMLGKLSSQIINKSDLARSIGVSQPTISQYLDIASGTFLWRSLLSFENSVSKSVVKMPRGHIRDSGLLHHLLRISNLDALQNDPIVGFSFESFVREEILKGLQDARLRNVDAYYYRTRSGAEIDLILEGAFGTIPIEIKYGQRVSRQQLRWLNEFVTENKLPFAVLINQSDTAEWLTEKIVQIPVGFV